MPVDAGPIALRPSTNGDEPFYFPADVAQLFGWLHWPETGRLSDIGLIICKPFGYEALCGHRSLRAFALMGAESGLPVLSFDYAGTGDSADIDESSDQIELWCRDIVNAGAELRQRTGVRRVCLLGFRLGALLASLAVARTTVDALILVAPILSGELYLRELRTMQLVAKQRADAPQVAETPTEQDDHSMEVAGYRLSARTISRLRQINLAAHGSPPVSTLLVIDRAELPAARTWIQSLSAPTLTEYVALPGSVGMMMTAPQFTAPPREMITRVQSWLQRLAASAPTARPAVRVGAESRGAASPTLLPLRQDESPDDESNEQPIRFGPDGILFGIITEPRCSELTRRVVVLVNAAADSHVCMGRLYVALARSLARRDYAVLRMDLAGLGDSDTRPGEPENDVYPPSAIDDIRAAIELVRHRYPLAEIVVAGLCSGAYHALQAASEAVDLDRVLMLNPEVFSWRQDMRIDDIQLVEVLAAKDVYRARVRSFKYWGKLLTGRVDVGHIARVQYRRLLLALSTGSARVARRIHIRLPNDLGTKLERIVRRGVHIDIVFARGEPGIELLRLQGGSSVRRLGDRCQVHIVEGADHNFSGAPSRLILEELLSKAM